MNPFASRTAAARYAKGRPYFHPAVIRRIRDRLKISTKLGMALDVGCGNGQSTVPLTEIAEDVLGIDASAEMIEYAWQADRVRYAVAPAEALPVADGQVDLITASTAHHWFDWPAFLPEARRVLRPEAWLVLYGNRFFAQMVGDPGFGEWMKANYGKRFPTPPKPAQSSGLSVEEAAGEHGFTIRLSEEYENTVDFTLTGLVDYLSTHSNIIAAVEGGRETLEDVQEFLSTSLAPYFRNDEESFQFGGDILYLQKLPA